MTFSYQLLTDYKLLGRYGHNMLIRLEIVVGVEIRVWRLSIDLDIGILELH